MVSTYSAPLCSSLPSVQAPIPGDEAISAAVSPSPLRSSFILLATAESAILLGGLGREDRHQ